MEHMRIFMNFLPGPMSCADFNRLQQHFVIETIKRCRGLKRHKCGWDQQNRCLFSGARPLVLIVLSWVPQLPNAKLATKWSIENFNQQIGF